MAILIELVNPQNNKSIKQKRIDDTYANVEQNVIELNQELNKKSNPKEMYWTITTINI